MNTKITTTKLEQFNTTVRPTWGEQKMVVECVAIINGEKYKIEFYRSPITGELKNVTCLGPAANYTTENTLVNDIVQDMVWDSLQGD